MQDAVTFIRILGDFFLLFMHIIRGVLGSCVWFDLKYLLSQSAIFGNSLSIRGVLLPVLSIATSLWFVMRFRDSMGAS